MTVQVTIEIDEAVCVHEEFLDGAEERLALVFLVCEGLEDALRSCVFQDSGASSFPDLDRRVVESEEKCAES